MDREEIAEKYALTPEQAAHISKISFNAHLLNRVLIRRTASYTVSDLFGCGRRYIYYKPGQDAEIVDRLYSLISAAAVQSPFTPKKKHALTAILKTQFHPETF